MCHLIGGLCEDTGACRCWKKNVDQGGSQGELELLEVLTLGHSAAGLYPREQVLDSLSHEAAMPSSIVEAPHLAEDDLDRVFDRAWALCTVRRAVARHEALARDADPAAQRRVDLLRQRFQEDMPIREIAKLWNEDAAHLHREYARARREFESALREEVAFHLPDAAEEIDDRLHGVYTEFPEEREERIQRFAEIVLKHRDKR